MKAVLEVNVNELNADFLKVIRNMFKKNVTEIVIKPQMLTLEEFDKSLPIGEVLQSLHDGGHNSGFLSEIKEGLENSSVYSKDEG